MNLEKIQRPARKKKGFQVKKFNHRLLKPHGYKYKLKGD